MVVDIGTELGNFLGEKRALVDAITREFHAGTPAKAIAREVAAAFSRDQVTQYLAAVSLQDTAREALREGGLDGAVGVSVTGIDPPREAHLTIGADPSEISGDADLPTRIRAALRDFHITLDLRQADRAEHDVVTADLIDKLLLGGEPVRLIKLRPRAPGRSAARRRTG
jgi:hypothetical protein